jgi:4-hydroxy-3-polyprenylbenzoate decarboxylase
MVWSDLRQFISALAEQGELHQVPVPVDPRHEIAAIADRVANQSDGGPALLFEQVAGSALPVAMNLYGSQRRMALALGVTELDELSGRMTTFLANGGAGLAPHVVDSGPSGEFVEPVADCDFLPVPIAWPHDGQPAHGGRFLTMATVVTRDHATATQNLGLYRVACFDGSSLGIHWRPGSGGARHHAGWQEAGEPTPVAIVLGSDPITTFCATLPLPVEIDELALAGFLNGQPITLTRCLTNDLLVPANAEIIIEGLVDPEETGNEGAFGNHTGYYVGGGQVPLVRVTAVTRRHDALLPATLVGPPPQENYWLALAGSRLLLPLLQRLVPAVIDLALPRAGIYHGAAVVAIKKERPGQAWEVMGAIWADSWLKQARLLIIVDADLPVTDFAQVYWRVLNQTVWGRDLVLADPGDSSCAADGRMGIDATRKLPAEAGGSEWPQELVWPEEVRSLLDRRWRDYGFTE